MELSDGKNYRCGACGVTHSTTLAGRKHKINKHIEVKKMFLRALGGKEFRREAKMESHSPPQTPAKSKNETAQRRDHEIGDELLPGGFPGSREARGVIPVTRAGELPHRHQTRSKGRLRQAEQ